MDYNASTHNLLERMLLDASVERTNMAIALLSAITNGFSDDRRIGSCGFAVVYKGLLQNGTVAVKKLFNALEMDDDKFIKEVASLMRMKQKNIVRFLGSCADTQGKIWHYKGKMVIAEEPQRLLYFEFRPKGCLDKYITDVSEGLEWRTRYQIIKGVCEGLYYLHQKNIVHLDLKPANILLNDDMVHKIADFGLSRCFDEKQSRAITKNLVGSQGYLAPEFDSGLITFKSDIYSLGVIIIEILTGQKAYPEIDNVLQGWSAGFIMSQGDKQLKTSWGDKRLELVRVCAEIGIKCIDYKLEKRPLKGRIIEMLDEMETKCGSTETDLCTSWVAHVEKGSSELQHGVPKVPGGTSSETSTSRVSKLAERVSTAPSQLQRIVCVPKGSGETSSSEIRSLGSTEISKLLEVYPSELRFPFEPDKPIQCPVSLINRTDQCVGVWIRQTNPNTCSDDDLEAGSWSSLSVILDPHSTLVVAMTLEEQQQPPEKFELLMLVMGSKSDLTSLESSISGYLNLDRDFFKRVEELGGEVHRAVLKAVICDPTSCQEVICNQKVSLPELELHHFIPATSKFGDILCIDVHPTETWILVGHFGFFTKEDGVTCPKEYVSIWNYETQEIVTVLQVIKPGLLNQVHWITSAKFIAREQWFATVDEDGCVHVYAYTTKDKVKEFEAHKGLRYVVLAVHPTDPFLLTGSYGDTWVKLWDWSKGWECTRRFDVHSYFVRRLMFDPRDRRTFASVSVDGTLKVWDIVYSSNPVTTLPARENFEYLSTDSHRHFLVTCGYNDHSWRADIWDSQTRNLVHTLDVSGRRMCDVACHPTLPLFVTLLDDEYGSTLCLWNASTYRLEKMVHSMNFQIHGHILHGAVFLTGTKDLTRLVVGSQPRISVMEINLPKVTIDGGNQGV
ncbi:uncharacterized protein LOC133887032 [Phragmites australis]|uniref:uncharacterized protein LOC133887032 n=1 Tax=Phragmites australis TaxID=29695 RepID=UPI002D77D477|nr:uncharacterized protein LOC133887032 [Phragmites australis]